MLSYYHINVNGALYWSFTARFVRIVCARSKKMTFSFVAELPRIVREYEECIALIKPREDVAAILAMSASTLDRAFKGLPRVKPFAVKANRRSGLNRPILDAIECRSGEEVMAEMQGRRQNIAVSRSRFYRKNDNAHVKQKNGSVARELFGELRND